MNRRFANYTILTNSQQNKCTRVFSNKDAGLQPAAFLKRDPQFSCEFCKFFKNNFYRTRPDHCFDKLNLPACLILIKKHSKSKSKTNLTGVSHLLSSFK